MTCPRAILYMIDGWMNYFGIAMKYNNAVELDHWLRRRIRMCYWKQWRRAKRRIRDKQS